jgi:hypothetical protein
MLTPLSSPTAPPRGVEILIMDAQPVDETKSTVVCPSPGIRNHTFTLKSSASITGGVQLETANDPAYTGIWAPLGGGPINVADIGPAAAGELQFQFSNVTFTALRARIDTVIAGGTLSVSYLGN